MKQRVLDRSHGELESWVELGWRRELREQARRMLLSSAQTITPQSCSLPFCKGSPTQAAAVQDDISRRAAASWALASPLAHAPLFCALGPKRQGGASVEQVQRIGLPFVLPRLLATTVLPLGPAVRLFAQLRAFSRTRRRLSNAACRGRYFTHVLMRCVQLCPSDSCVTPLLESVITDT